MLDGKFARIRGKQESDVSSYVRRATRKENVKKTRVFALGKQLSWGFMAVGAVVQTRKIGWVGIFHNKNVGVETQAFITFLLLKMERRVYIQNWAEKLAGYFRIHLGRRVAEIN